MTKNLLRLALVAAAAAAASRAEAFPAFARKYGMSCTACHVAWPILNQVGESFRDNGYQFGLGKDDPVTLSPGYVPVALRTTPQYLYTRTTNQAADDGTGTGGTKPVTTAVGGVPLPPGVDILTGGAIAPDISFLLVLAGFGPDGLAGVESASVRLSRLGGSSWANLRVGKFELDQPMSAHRGIALTSGYAVYGALLPGSMVPFDMGENQVGLELSGHDARSATRYALSLTSANGGESLGKGAWSSPMVYLHVQRAFETGSAALPWIRIGALGAVGWWPTKFENEPAPDPASPGTPGPPLAGTGSAGKPFSRVGAEVSAILGNPATPLLVTAAYIHGAEVKGLASGTDPVSGVDYATVSNSLDGGFLELDWVPWALSSYAATPWAFFARYDAVRVKRGPGNSDGFTAGARRYLALGPRASAAVHIEFHQDTVKRAGDIPGSSAYPGKDVQTQALMAGVDFDF